MLVTPPPPSLSLSGDVSWMALTCCGRICGCAWWCCSTGAAGGLIITVQHADDVRCVWGVSSSVDIRASRQSIPTLSGMFPKGNQRKQPVLPHARLLVELGV